MQVKDIKCPNCGVITRFSEGKRPHTCKFCGSQLTIGEEKAQASAEKIYYQKNNITVTATGLKILKTTYRLDKTTSAYKRIIPAKPLNSVIAGLIGLAIAVFSIYTIFHGSLQKTGDKICWGIGAVYGFLLMDYAIYRFIARKPRFGITLVTSEGEKPVPAPIFRKEQLIDEIVSAINEAAREKW